MVLLLGACASPDWIDPGTWFEDNPPQPEAIIIPDDNSPIPNLATVPTAPPVPSPQLQRQQITEGLEADRENARYSDEPLTADSTAVPEADPPAQGALPPATFDVANLGDSGGIASVPLAPPPPGDSGSAAPPPTQPGLVPGSSGSAPRLAAAQPTVQPTLLQHQAYQQLAQQQQNMQQLTLQRQAFELEARQRALQQQFLRQQAIDQQAIQRRALEIQARQLAGVSPFPQASALQVAPQTIAPSAALGGTAAALGGTAIGSTPYAATSSGLSYGQTQPAPAGNLVGVIYFEHGSTGLDGNDREVLQQVAYLAQQSGAGLQVVGHASARTGAFDATRHQMANFQVSLNRANRVAEALIGLGSPRERVNVSAQADSRPVYHEFMPTGEAGNRRVEIYLQY